MSARGAKSLKLDFRRLNVDMARGGKNTVSFKKFFKILHLVMMKKVRHFYYLYANSSDTTKKTHTDFW